MAVAFSSSDTSILDRNDDINGDDLVITEHNEINNHYEIDKCIEFIQEQACETVALQFPDELLGDAATVTQIIQSKTSAKVFLLADTSYGNFGVDEVAAQHIGADLIIHFGKASLVRSACTRTMFVFGQKTIGSQTVCDSFLASYSDKNTKILLIIEPQWSYITGYLEDTLKKEYCNLIVARMSIPDPLKCPSEDVSCINSCPDCTCRNNNITNDVEMMDETQTSTKCYRIGFYEVEIPQNNELGQYSLFFVGGNNTETLQNILFSVPSFTGHVFDAKSSKCSPISLPINKMMMKRYYVVEQVKDSKTVGILVGTMGMAGFREIISHLKKILSACGKKAYTFIVGKLNPNKLANFPEIDAFVLVACPEESIVESKDYFKPICTPYEVELACNANREWNNVYPLDFRQLLPGGKHFVEFKPLSDETDVSLITGRLRRHDDVRNDATTDLEARNMESRLSNFHPHSAAHHFATRSWAGLEQKLGETPVEKVHEGRSGLPISYTYDS